MTEEKSEDTIEEIQDPEVKAEEVTKEVTEDKAEEIELSVEERIETLERSINSILGTLENMAKPEDEEEQEEVEEEEEDKKKKSEPESKPEVKAEPEQVEKKSDPIQETLSAILEAILKLQNEKSKDDSIGELKVALKTSNDTVASLEKRVKILTKSEEKTEEVDQKTVQDKPEEIQLEKENPIVCERGVITSSKYFR